MQDLTHFGVAYELFIGRTGPGLRPIQCLDKAPAGTWDAVREEAQEVLCTVFGEDSECKHAHLQPMPPSLSYNTPLLSRPSTH